MDKFLQAEVKSLESENPNGEFLVTLSTPGLDRDGEIIDPGAFDPLPDHISFDIDHGMTTSKIVGSGAPFYDGNNLMVRGTFASTPLGQEVRSLVNEGHIRTTSVAMHKPHKETKSDGVHITKARLLNGAFVPIPANPEALVVSSKAGARNASKDAERLQRIHDDAVENGAVCSVKHVAPINIVNISPLQGVEQKSAEGEDATGADLKADESAREDASGADGNDEQQHLELRARALALIARSVT